MNLFPTRKLQKSKNFQRNLSLNIPEFKSIHEEETNIAIWRVVGWVIRTHTLLNHVRELLSIYTHISCPNITVEYTEEGKWIAKTQNDKDQKQFVRKMDCYYGINLIRDLIEFANETLS